MLKKYYKKLAILILLPAWVVVSFYTAQALACGIIWLIKYLGIPIALLNKSLLETIAAAFVYSLTLLIVVGLPWMMRRKATTLSEIGLDRLPTWTEIFIMPAGFVVYFILSAIMMLIASQVIPGFDINQAQDVGFSQLDHRYEYVLAFATLVVVAPAAEEMLFRGYLFGKLRTRVPLWVAIIVTSLVFGALHGAWNLAIDTFALSIVLCLLRKMTGSIWPSFLLHMAKNGIAFYVLFINPSIFVTLGR